MAIGNAPKEDLAFHLGHRIEVASYFDEASVTIECMDCGCILIDGQDEEAPDPDWEKER